MYSVCTGAGEKGESVLVVYRTLMIGITLPRKKIFTREMGSRILTRQRKNSYLRSAIISGSGRDPDPRIMLVMRRIYVEPESFLRF
jgi:hypothetical protein